MIRNAITQAQTLGGAAVQAVVVGITTAVDPATSSINSLVRAVDEAIRKVQELSASLASLPDLPNYSSGGGTTGGSFASGGYVSGPGSSTSDSIPAAWLSNGEYVINAAQVRRYGKNFFDALNFGRLKVPTMPKVGFATGGLVGSLAAAPAMSSSSGRPLTLVLDGKSFSGLSGPASVMEQLERHAMNQRISSTTRRAPSRVG